MNIIIFAGISVIGYGYIRETFYFYRHSMKYLFLSISLLFMSVYGMTQTALNEEMFFKAISSNSLSEMQSSLKMVVNSGSKDKEAFEGAMLMRMADKVSVPAKKMAQFKQGHKKLEKAIAANPNNATYRFLRLMIQENAPRALGYHKDIAEDSRFVAANNKSVSAAVQHAITGYSKKSKALSGGDL
ncbi:MAG: hypothetical protein QM727_06070 [Niabella sp.]